MGSVGQALLELAQLVGQLGGQPFADEAEVLLDQRDLAPPRLVVDGQQLELHVSGGSEHHIQYGGSCSIVRRDTHDADVPDAVFALVPEALARCPNLADVFLERIPEALDHPTQRVAFDAEFARLRMLVGGDV